MVSNPPVADFSANQTVIDAGQSVNFTDLSTENPTSWSWTFNGGTPANSSSQNPTVTYNTAGTYSVSLTATNAAGNDTETKTNYITVNAIPTYTLSTNTTGNGSISLNPSGGTYNEGTVITVTANPVSGNQFDNWSGDLTGSTNPYYNYHER
jgi:PKD repeat protein